MRDRVRIVPVDVETATLEVRSSPVVAPVEGDLVAVATRAPKELHGLARLIIKDPTAAAWVGRQRSFSGSG